MSDWEAGQRERNARALDTELHEAAVQGWAKTAASLQVEVIGLEAQLAGAVHRGDWFRQAWANAAHCSVEEAERAFETLGDITVPPVERGSS